MKNMLTMKKILYLIMIIGIGLFTSCEKENNNPVLDLGKIVPPVLTEPADGSELVLSEEHATDTVLFKWSAAQYNVEGLPATTYLLQADLADSNFSNPKNLVSTTDLEFKVSQEALNLALVNMGLEAGQIYDIEFRVMSYLVQQNPDTWVTSDSNRVAVTTYAGTPAEPAVLWVPGDYQGWDPASAPNIFSPAHDNKYAGFIYFPPGGTFEFKFTSAPDWAHINYGDGGEGMLDTDPGAGNLKVPGEGNYYLTVDTDALTWGSKLRNYALIGSFNDWAADEPLTWDNDNWRWEITRDFEANTEFKWRANGEWTYNLGDSGNGDNTLSQDGANIVIENPGNYTIYLYLYEPVPRYEIIQNK
jgi:hypothetical protein